MRKNAFVALSLLTVMVATLILPVSAAPKSVFKASGKILEFTQEGYPSEPIVIVSGHWQLTVYSTGDSNGYNGVISFKLFYQQVLPDGTHQKQEINIDGHVYRVTMNPDGCVVRPSPSQEIDVDSEDMSYSLQLSGGTFQEFIGSTAMMKFMPS